MFEHLFDYDGVVATAHILHADLDSFFASVEQRDDPSLRGRPVIVGGGVVLAASYEAKAYGVRGAMGGRQARRLCPDAVVVRPRMSAYSEASKAVFAVFTRTTPVVEGVSIDEAFLDVGGLRRLKGEPVDIAARLRHDVLHEVGLPITVGVARTKLLAKVASGLAKPDGLLAVPPEDEEAFLLPLPVERLWGVGPATAAKLHARGIMTVEQASRVDEHELVTIVGPAAARFLHAVSHLRDPRPVEGGRRRSSIGSQHAIGWGRTSDEDLDANLTALVDRVTKRLRGANRLCRTVTIRVRFDDSARITRSHSLAEVTASTPLILATARSLVAATMPLIRRRGITLIGVTLSGLRPDVPGQLALPFEGHPEDALDTALDRIRDKFGTSAITRGVLVGRDTGYAMPTLPV